MTANQLINELKKVDPNMEITLNGYEGGQYSPKNIETVKLAWNFRSDPYQGPHEDMSLNGVAISDEEIRDEETGYGHTGEIIHAILIS